MKCSKAEKMILLQDSGELAGRHNGALVAHLHDCEPCRRFQHALVESQRAFPPMGEPSAHVLNNIMREARKLAPESKQIRFAYWKPAVAMAAALMIGLGFFFASIRPDAVGLEMVMTETDLLNASEQIVSVMYSGLSEDDLAFNFLMTSGQES